MNHENVLVTGAAGFIGYHVVKKLLESGIKVTGIDNINDYYPTSLKFDRLGELGIKKEDIRYNTKNKSLIFKEFTFIRMDIVDSSALLLLFLEKKFTKVIHLAAQAGVRYSLENPKNYIDSNIVGFLNILEGCRHINIDHLVYASSSSVYGNNISMPFSETDRVDFPISLYAATKRANELMAHSYSHLFHFPTSGLRFFTVYGPWGRPDMAPFIFADAIAHAKPIKVFNHGEMSRDFTYIDDIVQGVIGITFQKQDVRAEIYNIGNSTPVNLLDFISCLEKAFNKKAEKIMTEMQPGDVTSTWADVSKLNNTIGYSPNTLIKDGTKKFVQWYKGYFKIKR